MNTSRLATVIFDSGRKIFETEYVAICETIMSDRFSLDPIVLEYKNKEKLLDSFLFVLNDGSRVLVTETDLANIRSVDIDRTKLAEFMQESKENFSRIISEIHNVK